MRAELLFLLLDQEEGKRRPCSQGAESLFVADPGEGSEGPEGPPPFSHSPLLPLFLDQIEARRVEKKIFGNGPPLTQSLDDRGSPYLKVWIRYCL